jgi:predicted  nucleic acid-binding Zn-ribbon protein
VSWLPVAGAAAAALLGGGAVAWFKVRPDNRRTDAATALALQEAMAKGIRTIQEETDYSIRHARENTASADKRAEALQRQLDGVEAQLRQMGAELLQARTDMQALRAEQAAERAQMADERASWGARDAESQMRVRGLEADLHQALAGQWNGSPKGIPGWDGG